MARHLKSSPRAPARRTGGQRAVLGLLSFLSVSAVLASVVAGYALVRYRSIDRKDVNVDALPPGSPANYLIIGSDSRDKGDPLDTSAKDDHQPLADTIMIVRVNPKAKTARVLSLPRDLWVDLPGGRRGRINEAYGKGAQTVIDVVRDELDIPINHYVEVDFKGFEKMVNAVGGIPIYFDRPMRDFHTGLQITDTGCQTLDGRSALAFARARYLQVQGTDGKWRADGAGDIGRIDRQQYFIRRVIDRAADKGITNPLTLKRLLDVGTASIGIDSSLSLSDMRGLGARYGTFRSDALDSYTLPVEQFFTPGGADVVQMNTTAAQPILAKFRPPKPKASASATSTTVGPTVAPSRVELAVMNSSGTPGRAVEVAATLKQKGFVVVRTGNGSELGHASEQESVVRYGSGSKELANTVVAALPGARAEADPGLAGGSIVLYLGSSGGGSGTPTTRRSSTTKATTTTQPMIKGAVPQEPPGARGC